MLASYCIAESFLKLLFPLGSQPPRGMTSPSPRHQQDSRSPREFAGGGGMPPSTSPAVIPSQGKGHPGLKVVIPNSSRQVDIETVFHYVKASVSACVFSSKTRLDLN